MRTWRLDIDVCGAFELVDWPLMQHLAKDHRYLPIVLFGRVFMHVRYLVGWCDSGHLFSLSDRLIFHSYDPMYPIH